MNQVVAQAEPAPGEAAVRGVDKSLTGRRWVARPYDDRQALAMAQRLSLPEIVARVLSARGVDADGADGFLDARLRRALPDPDHLKDMAAAVERVAVAVVQGEQVAVFGDYDVDGATSAALLLRCFASLGGRTMLYVPDRRREGYGPSSAALLGLRRDGASVAITVDCGTAAHQPVADAQAAGLDVVILDHHVSGARLPPAVAVVNPNRLDEASPHGQLAAVGVTFLFVVGLVRALRAMGWFANRDEPDLLSWLDLVALGTVCDVVPLTGVNRAFVAQGLKVLAKRRNTGLVALADVAGVSETPTAYHLGFLLGPRINAGGRVGESTLGARLLATDDAAEARAIADRLDQLNRHRRSVEEAVFQEALRTVEDGGPAPRAIVFAAGRDWHPGVIGIVAGRLKERFHLPAAVIAVDGDVGTGSARSVPGVDLGAMIVAACQAGLLVKGGGHPMAAGFTATAAGLDRLRDFLEERIADRIAKDEIVPRLHLDGFLTPGGATRDMIESLERVAPFGAGNPEPRFLFADVLLGRADPVGGNHLRCYLKGPGGPSLKSVAFRAMDSGLGRALLSHDGATFHVAGRLRVDTWGGVPRPQLLIDDAAPARGLALRSLTD